MSSISWKRFALSLCLGSAISPQIVQACDSLAGSYADGEGSPPTIWIDKKDGGFLLSAYSTQRQKWRHYQEPLRSLSREQLHEVPAGTSVPSCGLISSMGWRFVSINGAPKFLAPPLPGIVDLFRAAGVKPAPPVSVFELEPP